MQIHFNPFSLNLVAAGWLDDLHDQCFKNIILPVISKQTAKENNSRDQKLI